MLVWLMPVLLLLVGTSLWMHIDAARLEFGLNGVAVPWHDPSRPHWVNVAMVSLWRFIPDINLARVMVLPVIVAAVSIPVAFLAMRAALREARIRQDHFVRIIVTSLALPLWALAAWAIVSTAPVAGLLGSQTRFVSVMGWVVRSAALDDLSTLRRLHELRVERVVWLIPGFGVWLLFFWTFAAVRYLRIPRDRWFAIAMLATILTTVVTMATISRVPM